MVSLALSLPQWCDLSAQPLVQLSGATFSGTPTLPPYVTASGDTLSFTGGYIGARYTTLSPFTFSDTDGTSYSLTLTVAPSPISVRAGGVSNTVISIYQYYPSSNLPVTLDVCQNPAGTFSSNGSITSFPATLSGSFLSNAYIAPPLPPGLTSSISGSSFVITGNPTVVRPSSNYTYYVQSADRRQMSQPFALACLPGFHVWQPPISGNITLLSDTAIRANLVFGAFQVLQITTVPTPDVFVLSALPSGMQMQTFSNTLVVYGTPNRYADSGLTASVTITSAFTSVGSMVFQYANAVELCNVVTPNFLTYSNVTYTPFFQATATPQPLANAGHAIAWSLCGAPVTLSIDAVGRVLGSISQTSVVGVTARDVVNGAETTSFTTLYAVADAVEFSTPGPVEVEFPQQGYGEYTFSASSRSGQPVSYTMDPADEATLNSYQLYLEATSGRLAGTSIFSASLTTVPVYATTPQGVRTSISLTYSVVPDGIVFDPSRNFISASAIFVQGRDIALDYTVTERTYRAVTTIAGYEIARFGSTDLSDLGFRIKRGVLLGTPVVPGTCNVTITAYSRAFSNTLTVPYVILPDRMVLLQPTQTDYVLSVGESTSFALQVATHSGSSISAFSLQSSVSGVSITPTGVLSLVGTTPSGPTEFVVVAQTLGGVTLSKGFSLTVNSGTFVTPSETSAYLPIGASFPVYTSPLSNLTATTTLNGVAFSGSGQIYTFSNASSTDYPPALVTFRASPSLAWPVRVATQTVTIDPILESTQWIQYVSIPPITVSGTSPTGASLAFMIPNPPPGLVWDPTTRILSGRPTGLTTTGLFTIWATDGFTTAARTISYRVRVPTFLRGFKSPSAYTQYVRQRALVNGAVHAINKTAVLPDPLIASEGGSYPPDVSKPEYICREGLVIYF